METWKPLQPTSRYISSTLSPLSSTDAYAPPADSTRSAPPAHPHPYSIAGHGSASKSASVKRSSIFSWGSRGNSSKYAPPPVDASKISAPFASTLNAALPALKIDGSLRAASSALEPCIGRLPISAHLEIAELLPLDDLLNYILSCRQIAHLTAQEHLWRKRNRSVQWTSVKGCDVGEVEMPVVPRPPSAADEEWTEFASADMQEQISKASCTSPPISSPIFDPSSTAEGAVSFKSGSLIPSYTSLPSYRTIKSYKLSLRPILDSLEMSESVEDSLLFTTRQRTPLEQQALLGNMIRAVLPPSAGGGGLFASSSSPGSASRLMESTPSRCDILLDATSYMVTHLLSLFKAACERRFDALRAAEHGATGTSGAVMRAEGDMRAFAQALWLTGKSANRLADYRNNLRNEHEVTTQKPASFDLHATETYGSEAERTWFDLLETHNPLRWSNEPDANIVVSASNTPTLNFTPMDATMSTATSYLLTEGVLIARVFPPAQGVILHWGQRIAERLIAEYIRPLLELARSASVHLYLRSCAATFTQSLRLAEALLQVQPPSCLPAASALACADSTENETSLQRETDSWNVAFRDVLTQETSKLAVYQAWDSMVRDYLSEERVWIKTEMDRVASDWEQNLVNQAAASRVDAAFLTAQNPAAVKRTVLSSFKSVLLLPVTVVPRTAVNVGGAVFRTAGKGVSQLNPLRWQGAATGNDNHMPHSSSSTPGFDEGYIDFSKDAGTQVDHYGSEDEDAEPESPPLACAEDDGWNEEVKVWKEVANRATVEATHKPNSVVSLERHAILPGNIATPSVSRASTPALGMTSAAQGPTTSSLQRMQLLLSLDTALQMIHLNRDSLKRVSTFSTLPGGTGRQVQEAIEEVGGAFLQCLNERHVGPGFRQATLQMTNWKPTVMSRASTPLPDLATGLKSEGQQHVEPLVHFFELVHVADTIAQMVQVYFDQELSRHIDRTDFFNAVVREKKRFENALDEAVATGLNSGVDLLMGQIEHIVATTQDPRDFYPEAASDMDLGKPTTACSNAVSCLETHCKMLIGCTDKNVLEVFWQEIGIRLHSIVCKHLKRQIISLEGGFKVIADLNAYYAFIVGLKQSSLLPYFEALKMLGNLYVIEDPKELASLVRDASVFRGTLTPDDVYEFLQARCDFKIIEKAIDKEMYGFKVAEDCTIT